jgi:sigma-B regulation protein RsbU (phosphoserine phosphatase)
MTKTEATEQLFEIRFSAKPERLCLVRALVKRAAEVCGCNESLSEKLVIAVNEACMNIIQHAYKEDERGEIIMQIHNNDSQMLFRILDFAKPVDLSSVESRDLRDVRPGGLGVHFIREIMDDYRMGHLDKGRGNYLEMKKKIG